MRKKDAKCSVYTVNSFKTTPKYDAKCAVYTVNSFKMLTKMMKNAPFTP